jgi:glycosyltransferase involved in cell wall biosynthesis
VTSGGRRAVLAPVPIATIVVDLTPVLPGGENGGAKVFALELVRRLSALAPGTQLVLLTQAASHEELAALDAANVRRVMALGPEAAARRGRLAGLAGWVLGRVPVSLRAQAGAIAYRAHALLKRRGAGRVLRELRADLLFCPFTAPTFREPGIPTVCTIYDLQFAAYPQFFSPDDCVQRERAFRDACRHADRLAAISDFTRAAAISAAALDPARIRTIPLETGDRLFLSHGGTRGVSPILVYPANFWRHKNHEMLLTAFAIACRSGLPADVRLVCTGAPGARRDWLERVTRGMGLGGRVEFPGFLPREELRGLLVGARGLVFPSLYEGFGLPVVEAMAAGVPVACGNTTSLPEVAGDAALFFDPRIPDAMARAMVALAGDEDLRARLIESGRRRAAAFADPDRMAASYWALFAEALGAQHAKATA